MVPISTICPISTIGTPSFQSNLKVSESSINVIFIVLILIRLGNIGLKSGLELKNRKKIFLELEIQVPH